jgi:DNA-binding MarR family transcriptional regulator
VGRHWKAGDDPAAGAPASDGRASGQRRADYQPGDQQALSDQAFNDQAGRIWAAMRALVDSQPTKQRLRDALDIGRGSGRVKSLMWLTEGPLSLSGLAEAVGVDAPYATLIVDSLEQRGLVERQPDPADRRRKLVTLTPAGKDAVAQVLRIQHEPPPGFASLTAAELGTLEELVRRITGGTL